MNGPPREVLAKQDYTFHLFVDGVCEPTSAARDEFVTSKGAVLIGPNGKGIHFFGLELPACVTRAWCGGKRRQLIFEAEVLPYVLSLALWSDILIGPRTFPYSVYRQRCCQAFMDHMHCKEPFRPKDVAQRSTDGN